MQPALSIVRSWSVSVSRGDWVAAHDDEAVGGCVGVGVGVGAASSAVFWTSAFSPKDGCRCCCCCCCACGAFSQKATPKPPSAFDGLVTRWKEEEEGAAPLLLLLLLAPASGVSKPSERSAAPKLASTSAGRSVPSAETHSARSTMAVGHNGAPAACSSFVYAAFEEMVSLNVADG